MEKKYQIFISSTYIDLKNERQAVSRAILDLGHIPSGMEMFPASNSSQIDYIKKVIDDCDYYVLIIGGRYGSLDESGISYTEQEYNYALDRKIPILAFIHHDIGQLLSKDTEKTTELQERLEKFKQKVQAGRITKYWGDVNDLQSNVITSLTSEFRSNPRIGWSRDTGQVPREAMERIAKLSRQVEDYRERYFAELRKLRGYEDLTDSSIEIRFTASEGPTKQVYRGEEIIRAFAPGLRVGLSEADIREGLISLISHSTGEPAEQISIPKISVDNILLFFDVFEIAELLDIDSGAVRILEKKKYLLKAAFRPLKQVVDDGEIPF